MISKIKDLVFFWVCSFGIAVGAVFAIFMASGCKLHAYGDSSGGDTSTTTTTADDGSVVNDNDVSAGGNVSADDGSGVAQGGNVAVSDADEEFEDQTDLEKCRDGAIYKAESESHGELAVIFPGVCPDFIEACAFLAEIEEGGNEECVLINDPGSSVDPITGQLKFQFERDGQEYTGLVLATDDQGDVFDFEFDSTGARDDGADSGTDVN